MSNKIFEGIKVADFTWVGVGPITIKNLADHGATVVHIESHTHLDTLRMTPPFKDGVAGVNNSAFMADYNTSKYGVSLDVNKPKGVEIARKLILWADVVAESFSPRAMAKWGLDYETIRKLKPDIIYYSASQQGHGGPHSGFIGFGMMMASLSGYAHLTGWPRPRPCHALRRLHGLHIAFLRVRRLGSRTGPPPKDRSGPALGPVTVGVRPAAHRPRADGLRTQR